jgi:DNA-binding XRE family transcriptional regulator
LDKREAIIYSDSRDTAEGFLEASSAQSMLLVPILNGADALGMISLMSTQKEFFGEKDIGRVQLLAALIAFIQSRSRKASTNTEAAAKLGRALSGIHAELGLTQDELAYRGGLNRIALSQLEKGRWPPSLGPIYKWCSTLVLSTSSLNESPHGLRCTAHGPDESA